MASYDTIQVSGIYLHTFQLIASISFKFLTNKNTKFYQKWQDATNIGLELDPVKHGYISFHKIRTLHKNVCDKKLLNI